MKTKQNKNKKEKKIHKLFDCFFFFHSLETRCTVNDFLYYIVGVLHSVAFKASRFTSYMKTYVYSIFLYIFTSISVVCQFFVSNRTQFEQVQPGLKKWFGFLVIIWIMKVQKVYKLYDHHCSR